MAGIAQRNTSPELTVRALLHAMGVRYRLDARDLPGSPDIVNRKRRWAIFVHGCFWHRHPRCKLATTPSRNRDFWLQKFRRNQQRDAEVEHALRDAGYQVLVIWECETRNTETLQAAIGRLMSS